MGAKTYNVLFVCTGNSACSIIAEGLMNDAAKGRFSFWPGQPMTAHWGVPDPPAFVGSDEEKRQHFRDVAVTLHRRIALMLALPLGNLDSMPIHREVRDIGTR